MSAYFAPAFFSYLLGKSLKHSNPLLEVSKLGFVVIGTFLIVWWPYLHSKDAFFGVSSVVQLMVVYKVLYSIRMHFHNL